MKTKLLVVSGGLALGGIERSLIELLRALDPERVETELLLCAHTGELFWELPGHVRLLPEQRLLASMQQPLRQVLRQGLPLAAAARVLAALQTRRAFPVPPNSGDAVVFATLQRYWENTLPLLPPLKTEYDAAISFQWPHHYVAAKVSARRKFCWVHTDHRRAAVVHAKDEAVWAAYDGIAAVSSGVKEAFAACCPALEQRCFVFENLLDPLTVRQKAAAFIPEDMSAPPGGHCLLTVGRFCYQKAFDRAVLICRALLERGCRLRWYAIGYGTEEANLRAQVAAAGLAEHFVLLGRRSNPYPYMKACDLYVQPSRYEGKAVTVMEALTLGKPVAMTEFLTARAHAAPDEALFVPGEPAQAAAAIAALLANPVAMAHLAAAARKKDCSGHKQLEALYARLEGREPSV